MDTTRGRDTAFGARAVGEVVAEDYRRSGAFKRFGIDFCCGGNRTVQEACDRKGVDYGELERALLASTRSRDAASHPDPLGWELDFLADYIVNVHHRYVREALPTIGQMANKVAKVHGHARPEVEMIAALVRDLSAELAEHMAKEEELLFPYVRTLVKTKRDGATRTTEPTAPTADAIREMEEEHDRAGEVLRRIRALSSDYQPPEGACNTYRAAYALLEEFEGDLHRHVHLENNLLFPATAELERELAGDP